MQSKELTLLPSIELTPAALAQQGGTRKQSNQSLTCSVPMTMIWPPVIRHSGSNRFIDPGKIVMNFEWDETKARANEKKHGVSFLEATEVFCDVHSSCVQDPDHSYNEDRHLLFGVSSKGNALVVSYTERSDRIRIISARRMTNQERKAYEE